MKEMNDNYGSFLVDSHITQHDEAHLSKLTADSFVSAMKRTGSDSAIVYSACHNGNYYYPERTGRLHKGLKGRDHFGETVALLRKEGILPRAYCTVVYQREIARSNPQWRVLQVDGTQSYRRSWHLCPNAKGYVEYACNHLKEVCAYDIEAIFIDMTFWPGVCVCANCREKYHLETGGEIPTVVDWNDPKWVRYHRARERWLADFAHALTDACKSVKPDIAVGHQFGVVLLGWMYGQSHRLSTANDIPSGDFYGGRHQHRLGAKVLAAYEKKLPFEWMTSRCVNLWDHTSTKSDEEMVASCASTLANGGTYLLIDAINPDGSLEPKFYDRMETIGQLLEPFRKKLAELRPKLFADTAIYFSTNANIRRDHNGQTLREVMNPANNMLAVNDLKPVQEAMGAAMALNRARMPYRVVTDGTTDFSGLKTIIMNDISVLTAPEVDRLRKFVADGGTLIATGLTSYQDIDGNTTGDFAMKDVFGVSFTGKFSRQWNYVAMPAGEFISNDAAGPLVKATTAKRIAPVNEPLFDYMDLDHFASYHSNPPGRNTDFDALTINQFGRGKCLYLFSSLMIKHNHAQQTFAADLFRQHVPSQIVHECNAPQSVEVTILKGTRKPAFLLCFVNYQDEAPTIPVHDLTITFSLPGSASVKSGTLVSNNQKIEITSQNGKLTLKLPRLDVVEMVQIDVASDQPQ